MSREVPVLRASVLKPRHPERICWGCEQYCPADDLACGNSTIRTPHPLELFGDDWLEWSGRDRQPRGDVAESGMDAADAPRPHEVHDEGV